MILFQPSNVSRGLAYLQSVQFVSVTYLFAEKIGVLPAINLKKKQLSLLHHVPKSALWETTYNLNLVDLN